MAYIWNKDLETGNATIDAQHKQLIEAINKLLDACGKGQGRNELEKTMTFLSDYVARHFADEEALQIKSKYPDYTAHKTYHEGFKKVVREISEELRRDGPTLILVGKVNQSIGGWLVNHIKREDVKVAAHLKNAGL